MVNSKKLLSLFLAVVMLFSVLTVMASAYSVGDDIADGVNYKYTVEKVATVPETAAGSAEWSADNIYAVSLWMKASMGVDTINTGLHYNKTLFSPITLSDGECTYPYGAGLDQDTYYTEMGEGAVYAYSLGDYMNNTGMYKADGSTATTKALAKCIGLGNSNSAGVTVEAELVSPDHPLYNKWGAGLPEYAGVLRVNLDVAGTAKAAYLNTIEGINYSTDWNKMFTFYFESIADDVTGAEFGIFTEDCFTVDANVDGTGSGYFVGATSYKAVRPATNISGNAVVEAAAPTYLVNPVKNQIQWNDKDANSVNVGVVAGFSADDIAIDFGDDNIADNVSEVGAIFKINGVQQDNLKTTRVYAVNGGESYNFRIVLGNISTETTDTYSVTPYVVYNGTPEYGPEITVTPDDVADMVTRLS